MPYALPAGKPMPQFKLPLVGGGDVNVGENLTAGRVTLFSCYRGIHCPFCKKHNMKLEEHLSELDQLGVDVVFVSMNDKDKAEKSTADWGIKSKVAYGMSEAQANSLGLYVSNGVEAYGDPEVFSEPGLFMLNPEGALLFVDISNAPFLRPDVPHLIAGLEYVLRKSYPIRGTRTA
jgi:peroxiredoxin